METPELTIIAPMYNEEDVIELFFTEIQKHLSKLNVVYEIICINDGSKDGTLDKLRHFSSHDSRIKIINFSRNFGKEQALTAGIDFSAGKAAIPIDCDLQDPPELIANMYEKWKEGYDVVLAKRIDRSSDTLAKRATSSLFYKLLNKLSHINIPENVGDFRLIDRKVIDALKTYPEYNRFMKGIFASVGFKETTIEYVRPPRLAGVTSWNYFNLYKLAIEGMISFTSLPLKIWSYIGAIVSISSFFYGLYLTIKTLIFGIDIPGYASMMVVLLIMSGLILLSLGVIGEYLSRIFIEVKHRPGYIVMDKIGFNK